MMRKVAVGPKEIKSALFFIGRYEMCVGGMHIYIFINSEQYNDFKCCRVAGLH